MGDLKTEQLEAIGRLLIDPLRDAVRQEMRMSHSRLSGAIEKLDERMAGRIADHDRRIVEVEKSTVEFRSLRRKIIAVYGALTLVLSLAWSVVRDKLLSYLNRF